MKIGFSVNETVNKRYSVRTYDSRPVEEEIREKILVYAANLENPLGPRVNFKFIEKEASSNGEKLGTYGVIKGADLYLGTTIPDEECAPEALGYDLEQLILYMTSLGLGTCWLGGTFNRGAFAETMEINENELFPIITPVGYPAKKQRVAEKLFRRTLKADARLPWETLFFMGDFNKPLSKEEAGKYEFPLEMLRMAPSAVNKQPWRVVFADNAFHFFEHHSLGVSEAGTIDMQRIDVGIGICHFHLAAMEQNLSGRFEKRELLELVLPSNTTYITSWIMEEVSIK